ncbi:hypothetical protein [Nodosilinea nodulosa]|uniref:hypothetical protein n=1 Tax=Nodosilinea nodulosa TaxID=416001 RepID=UPI000308E290|nr:hypothetical protein [Nodosilinea nodulosa]
MTLTHSLGRATLWTFAGIGMLSAGLVLRGLAIDIGNFDRTQGGYDPPYVGWTGTPVDWASVDTTPTGMARRGIATNLLVDCTSGLISVQVYGTTIPFRPFSPRALAVHKPREACLSKGFTPEF